MVYNEKVPSSTPTNDLGGDMPQERLDRIKAAWMASTGKSEADWIAFQPAEIPLPETAGVLSDTDDASVTLCPTPEILYYRYESTAKYHLRMARKYGRTPKGLSHFEDAMFYAGLAKDEAERHNRSISLIRGGV